MGSGRAADQNIKGAVVIFDTLRRTGLPCAYSHFKKAQTPPYIVYIGSGQDDLNADDTKYWTRNRFQVEYYFTEKDLQAEAAIEANLLADGYLYEKSSDVYIEDEGVFVIYYQV